MTKSFVWFRVINDPIPSNKRLVIELDLVNYAVSEKEVGCDDIDRGDTADRATGFTGQWAALGAAGLYWAVIDCTGLSWYV